MTKTTVFLTMVGLLAFYGVERYSALTKEEVGYVYHPETDDVYTVVFGAAPDRLFKKHLLLPFHSPTREIKVAEENGTMHAFLEAKAARDTLFTFGESRVHGESLSTEWVRWAGTAMDSIRRFGYRWDFPDLAWVPRRDLDARDLLPLELLVVLPAEFTAWFWDDIHPVDAVVLKEQIDAPIRDVAARPNEIAVLKGAVMIRGRAARYLDRLLFGR